MAKRKHPGNTSGLGSQCVFVDVDRQDESKSAPCVFGFNVGLSANSFSSSSCVIQPPPPPLIRSHFLCLSLSLVSTSLYSNSQRQREKTLFFTKSHLHKFNFRWSIFSNLVLDEGGGHKTLKVTFITMTQKYKKMMK